MGLWDFFTSRKPSREAFAKSLSAELKRVTGQPFEYDAVAYALKSSDWLVHLGNLYQEHLRVPKQDRPAHLKQLARPFHPARVEMPEDFSDVRPDLLPAVRHRMSLEVLRLRVSDWDEKNGWPHSIIADHLVDPIVYDWQDRMQFVQHKDLASWGVTPYEAMEVARENLLDRTRQTLGQIEPGLWVSGWQDNYDASRILLHDFIREHEVNGRPVALVPTRDLLLLTGSDDIAGLQRMASIAEKCSEDARPVSNRPIVLDGDQWQPFELPADYPAANSYDRLRQIELLRDYEDQQGLLEERLASLGQDVFVGRFTLVEEQGRLFSYCVWTEGAGGLLPRTDRVALVRHVPGNEKPEFLGMTTWDRLASVAVDALRLAPDYYPERWEVVRFPSATELNALDP